MKKEKKPELSIVIATRAEPHLEATIADARKKAGARVEVVAVFDDGDEAAAAASSADHCVVFRSPRGVGAARHAGISRASSDLIVLADAHMLFQDGWARAFTRHFAAKGNQKDVVCGKMFAMAEYGAVEQGTPYTGARMVERARSEHGEHVVLTAVWHRQAPGPIGAIMGAFYGFRKDWYLKMGEPLAPLVGWGMDEEMLSVGAWVCGGRVQLLDVWAAHLMKTGNRINYTPEPDHNTRIWLNRFRIAELIPAAADSRDLWTMWLALNPIGHTEQFKARLAEDRERPEVKRIRGTWAAGAGTWADYAARYLDPEPRMGSPRFVAEATKEIVDRVGQVERAGEVVPPAAAAAQIPRAQLVPVVQCPNCGAYDSARWYSSKSDASATRRYGRCATIECRLPVVCVERCGQRRYLWGKDSAFAD